MTRAAPDWGALQSAIAGELVLPGSPDYESVRKPAIARFHDVRPQVVVLCGTPADVCEAISLAKRSGLKTATRSGGHCFAGRSSTSGMVIDVSDTLGVGLGRGGKGGRRSAPRADTLETKNFPLGKHALDGGGP